MKRYIFLMFYLLLLSCSSIENKATITNFEKKIISNEVIKVQNEIIDLAKIDNKDEIKKRIVTTLKNEMILSHLSNYNFSEFIIMFSEELEVLSSNKVKSILLINYETETWYFDIIWEKEDNNWMISSVEFE
ncbi:hypothetical protein STFE110948_00520 [Streptobacillus felis]|uniref:DUF4829 domain-containing protein n=1 Tax=Streptobacillus felis TaxID=1384509 RepID=A0A7Z0T9Q8_9FUSO|nr:hypothetical protein [Streptobacillus felis]NYV27260.1 hypothetical protein [Streptobacillus felis]